MLHAFKILAKPDKTPANIRQKALICCYFETLYSLENVQQGNNYGK